MTAVQLPPGEDCGRPPPEGFETFFMHYEPRLRRYLYTLGARDSLLEDAAQMTLEEAFRSWPSLQDHPGRTRGCSKWLGSATPRPTKSI